jgi:hypothetical protein
MAGVEGGWRRGVCAFFRELVCRGQIKSFPRPQYSGGRAGEGGFLPLCAATPMHIPRYLPNPLLDPPPEYRGRR